MRIFYGLILGSILVTIFLISYKRNKDLFSPLCIYSLFQFLRYVPNIIWADEEHWFFLDDYNTLKLLCMELVVIFSVVVGYLFYNGRFSSTEKQFGVIKTKKSISLTIIMVIFLIGLSSRFYVIYQSGGILYILNNIGTAYLGLSSSGLGYVIALSSLMIISMLMLLDKIKTEKQYNNDRKKLAYNLIFYKIILLIMITSYALSYLLFSSRSPVMEMVMILAFGFNYLYKKFKLRYLLKPRYFGFVILIFGIIVLMPIIRNSGDNKLSSEALVEMLGDNFTEIFDEFSNVGRDAYVYDHFNLNNFWFGKTYLNLVKAPIPSSLYPNKPPMDDGIYLNQLLHGYDVSPNQGRTELLFNYSIPFSTQGAMYANFGILGVIISGLFMGMLYARFYKIVKDTKIVFTIIIYQLIIYQLELTTLSIMQTIIPLIIVLVVYRTVSGVRIIRYKKMDGRKKDIGRLGINE